MQWTILIGVGVLYAALGIFDSDILHQVSARTRFFSRVLGRSTTRIMRIVLGLLMVVGGALGLMGVFG